MGPRSTIFCQNMAQQVLSCPIALRTPHLLVVDKPLSQPTSLRPQLETMARFSKNVRGILLIMAYSEIHETWQLKIR